MDDKNDAEGRPLKFLGLSKVQFALVAVLMTVVFVSFGTLNIVFSVGANADRVAEIGELAEENQRITERLNAAHQRLAGTARESHLTLCAVRENTEEQIEATLEFLASHPVPEPIQGISRDELLSGLERQKDFRKALSPVECSDVTNP